MNHKYYLDPVGKHYYHIGILNCDICNGEINKGFILNTLWSKKKNAEIKHVCIGCVPKLKSISDVEERNLFFCTDNVLPSFQLWIPTPPVVNFSKVKDNYMGEIIDHTRLSGRPRCTFHISDTDKRERIQISECQTEEAKQKTAERIKELDSVTTNDIIDGYFDNLTKSVPVIEENKKRLIENGE